MLPTRHHYNFCLKASLHFLTFKQVVYLAKSVPISAIWTDELLEDLISFRSPGVFKDELEAVATECVDRLATGLEMIEEKLASYETQRLASDKISLRSLKRS